MKTYRTPGATATEWSPTGNGQEVQRLETIVGSSTEAFTVPVTLNLDGETTRKGVRRMVLRASTALPATIMNALLGPNSTYDPKGSTPISAHVVIQAPQLVVQGELASGADSGVNALICKMVQDLIAVLTNESTTVSSDLKPDRLPRGLVYRTLAGASSLDIISGEYGESAERP